MLSFDNLRISCSVAWFCAFFTRFLESSRDFEWNFVIFCDHLMFRVDIVRISYSAVWFWYFLLRFLGISSDILWFCYIVLCFVWFLLSTLILWGFCVVLSDFPTFCCNLSIFRVFSSEVLFICFAWFLMFCMILCNYIVGISWNV